MVLQTTWRLHDVRDVEALVLDEIRRSPHVHGLAPHDLDDLIAWLLEHAWRTSNAYDPARGTRFSTMLVPVVRRRIVDWHRSRYRTVWKFRDRVYERPRPRLVSLDDPGLGESLGSRAGDLEDGCDPALARVLNPRDRTRAQDVATLGLRPARRAPRRTRTSDVADTLR